MSNKIVYLPVVREENGTKTVDISGLSEILNKRVSTFRAARVNVHKYRDAVRKYEMAVTIMNTIKKAMEVCISINFMAFFLLGSMMDSEEITWLLEAILFLIGITLLECGIIKIPNPKVPKGVDVIDGQYMIIDNTYKGHTAVTLGNTPVFTDGRMAITPFTIEDPDDPHWW